MTESERVLHLLLHELRTPLGVACGYVRLVRDQLLPTPEERDRALAGTQTALGGISQLCEDAGAFLSKPPVPAPSRVAAPVLINWVAALLRERGFETHTAEIEARHTVAVGVSLDAIADAIITLLAAVARQAHTSGVAVTVDAHASDLRFVVAGPGEPPPVFDSVFDPWRGGHGLSVPLACRVIEAAGGRVWAAA